MELAWVLFSREKLISELTETLDHADENIDAYDDFLSSWQCLVASDKQNFGQKYNDIEKFAVKKLSNIVEKYNASSSYATNPLFNSLHNSVAICNIDGTVLAANKQAIKNHALTIGRVLDSLNLRLEDGISISTKLRALLMSKSSESRLSLLQFYQQDDYSVFPIVIMRLEDSESNAAKALIIFLDAACNHETLQLLSLKFGLTNAETGVVALFSQGLSLKEIAHSRHRSHTTIRNQFQSALVKTGCPNQVDLLRMLLGMSHLLSCTEMIIPEDEEGLGKKIEVMRPHGRFVDVRLYGCPTGKPFIALPSLFGMPITKDIENMLSARSMLMIGVWRPGFSHTSAPHKDEDYFQCLADDITAVLNNIGIERCPFIGRASAALSIFKLARLIPERISAASIVNSLIPLPYVTQNKIKSRWTLSLVSAVQYSSSFTALILEMGQKLMIRHGVKHFLTKMYKASKSDLLAICDDNIVSSVHNGVLLGAHQGLAFPIKDMTDGFKDWSDDVKCLKIKVTLFQGHTDPNVSIKASREFANDFPEQVELVEFSDGGGLLNYTHTREIIDWVDCQNTAYLTCCQ